MPAKKVPMPLAETVLESVKSRTQQIKGIMGDSAPLKEKKPRKPLTDEQKATRVANLQKAREAKKTLKETKLTVPK